MKIFTVHLSKVSETRDDPELVPETFSFWAFWGLFFWTAYYRCWVASLVLVALEIILWSSQSYFQLSMSFSLVGQFFLCLVIGFNGQDLRRSALERRGFKIEAVVSGTSIEAALLRWRDKTFFDEAQKAIIEKY